MTVTFKEIKYGHYRRALELQAKIDAGQANDDELLCYAISLVKAWDFVDSETWLPIPVDPAQRDNLTLAQFKEVNASLNAIFGENGKVKKTKGLPSSSGSTVSKPAKAHKQNHLSG